MSRMQPIVGKLRKLVARDLVVSLSVGTVCAFAWWNYHHVPKFQKFDAYFKAVQDEIAQENAVLKQE